MAEAVRIRVEPRDSQKNKGTGTRVARRLRKNGLIPGVIYGHKQAVVPVASKLAALGYTHVKDYAGGKQDWIDAGLPTVSDLEMAAPPP